MKTLLDKGMSNVFQLHNIYMAGDIGQKREVIGSVFPEKFQFHNYILRTTKVNEVIKLIYTLAVVSEVVKIKSR